MSAPPPKRTPGKKGTAVAAPPARAYPHSQEAERAVLAGVFLKPDVMHSFADMLKKDDFYVPAHQILYSAFLDLYGKSGPTGIDIVTVSERLHAHALLEQAGGAVFLAELTEAVVVGASAPHYAGIVRKYSEQRKVIDHCNAVAAEAFSKGADVEALKAKLRAAVDGPSALSRRPLQVDISAFSGPRYLGEYPPRYAWLLDKSLPLACLGAIVGPPGAGKGTFAIQLCIAVAAGVAV